MRRGRRKWSWGCRG